MTPEAQRIAVAEACPEIAFIHHGIPRWKDQPQNTFDPLSDANAMHEALNIFDTLGQWLQFRFHLSRIVLGLKAERGGYVPNHRRADGTKHWFDCVHATAAQLAEAFLRTLNLYEDSDT